MPKIKQMERPTNAGGSNGAVEGMLFGLIFFIPFLGMAVWTALDALTGKFSDYNFDDRHIKLAEQKITQGTFALLPLISETVLDKVSDAAQKIVLKFELLLTNLSKEQEDQFSQDFEVK